MSKSSYYIIVTCIVTFLTSAVSFAAIDFDNSNFSPNFTNLNNSNDALVDGNLFVKSINLNNSKGDAENIIIKGQVQFDDAITGNNGNLRISSDVDIIGDLDATNIVNPNFSGNVSTDNITVNSIIKPSANADTLRIGQPNFINSIFKLQVEGQLQSDSIKARGSNVPAAATSDITRIANTLRSFALSPYNSTYLINSTFNYTAGAKYAWCNDNDIVLSCHDSFYNGVFKTYTFPLISSESQGCIAYYQDSGLGGSSYNGIRALCLKLYSN